MILQHMYNRSQPHIDRVVDDFGREIVFRYGGSPIDGKTVQLSYYYLDGFCDPDFYNDVWGTL